MRPHLLLLVLLLAATSRANPAFVQWADAFTADWARANPQFTTTAQYFSGAEQDALDRRLTNGSGTKAARERAALARRGLEELKRFPLDSLTPAERTSAGLLTWAFNNAISTAEFIQHRAVFDQFSGLQLGLVNFLTQTHPIRNPHDVENYLARLQLVAGLIDEGIADARAAEKAGFLPPRFIVERVIEQLDGFLMLPAKENVFVSSLNSRIGLLGGAVSPEARTSAVASAEKTVNDAVIPAYKRIRAMLAEQLPKTTADAGIWRLPRGAAAYQQALGTYTTTSLSADEIHAIGLREVARIEGEMDKILRQLGFNDGTVQERFVKLQATLTPAMEPDPRPAIVEELKKIVSDAEKRCAELFDVLPKAPVEVHREPPFSEKTAAAHYTLPAPDGSKPGIYWIPLANFSPQVVWLGAGLRTTAYHEAVPGHHFQGTIQQESTELPRFRKSSVFGFISAHGEGWALYAERLADENGWYADDPRGRLGYLNAQLFRARRLVVDTGLHAKKWTRQQAIDYGISPAEVERYIVWPGQACSYMIGQMRIVELREKARAAMGAKFSIKAFHNLVLRVGNVPLDVLGQEVDRWIAGAGAAPAATSSVDPRDLPPPKRTVVPKLKGTLTIDGELNEAVWAQAAKLGPFMLADGSRQERESTIVRAWYDDKALYLGWTCTDSDIQATFTARDSKFWEEEVAEFFITPKDLTRYFELQWNPLGGVFDAIITNELDERGVSKKFTGDWSYTATGMKSAVKVRGTVANAKDKDELWQVEVAIPWADFGEPAPKAGDVWRANFYRFNRGSNQPEEQVSWSPPMLRGFHQPSRFGFLEFGK